MDSTIVKEIIVPSCNYRLGNTGYGAAIVRKLTYTLIFNVYSSVQRRMATCFTLFYGFRHDTKPFACTFYSFHVWLVSLQLIKERIQSVAIDCRAQLWKSLKSISTAEFICMDCRRSKKRIWIWRKSDKIKKVKKWKVEFKVVGKNFGFYFPKSKEELETEQRLSRLKLPNCICLRGVYSIEMIPLLF